MNLNEMFCKKKEDEIRLLKEEVDQLKSELRKEKERNRKKKIGYREKCLKQAVKMAKELGMEIPVEIMTIDYLKNSELQ